MAVTGMANLAVKVADLDAAVSFYEGAGAEVRDRMHWNNGERADVFLGPVMITLFTHAIYEDSVDAPRRGIPPPRALHRRPRRRARGPQCDLGPGRSRRDIREAPHRVRQRARAASGSSSWSSSSRPPARGRPKEVTREGDALSSRLGEHQRARRSTSWPPSTATSSDWTTRHDPTSPACPGTGTSSAIKSSISWEHPPGGPPSTATGHHYCVAVADLDAAVAELEERGIDYQRAVQGESTVQIWINDPAGNTIELQQDTSVG